MYTTEITALPKELRKLIKKDETIKKLMNSIHDYNKFIPSVSSVHQLQISLSKLTE